MAGKLVGHLANDVCWHVFLREMGSFLRRGGFLRCGRPAGRADDGGANLRNFVKVRRLLKKQFLSSHSVSTVSSSLVVCPSVHPAAGGGGGGGAPLHGVFSRWSLRHPSLPQSQTHFPFVSHLFPTSLLCVDDDRVHVSATGAPNK